MKIKLLKVLAALFLLALSCPSRASAQKPVTVETLQRLVAAFNAHDLDAVMSFFADDCELFMPRGPEPWGQRYVGKAEVRKGLAARFEGIPDVHYGENENWVSGNHGVSRWTLTGTTKDGKKIKVRGCDLLEFQDGKIVRKDSYWKIVEPKS
ncbi:MAG TPA: nuclear transport factor 2 family protein [Candidatus Acidoferrales bacterium]|nr:nuclear transport factor 2 family protein [Candidatus Acidoferrales bacterium]